MRLKRFATLLCTTFLLATFAVAQAEKASDEKAEKKATKEKEHKAKPAKMGEEDQVKAWLNEGREAAIKGDASWAEKSLGQNYVFVAPGGSVRNREETLEMMKKGVVKYQSIEASDESVKITGNVATYTAKVAVKATNDGKDISGDYRIARVAVKQGGSWKLVEGSSTKIEAPMMK